MRTLLVLSNQQNFAAALQSALDPARFQIIVKSNAVEASLLLNRGAIDATILDAELPGPRALRGIEEIRVHAPGCPVILFTGEKHCSWEEDAYVLGVAHVPECKAFLFIGAGLYLIDKLLRFAWTLLPRRTISFQALSGDRSVCIL
jgi:hypothetical protein